MIRGMHAMFYSSQAEALRAFFKDKLGLAGTDVGGAAEINVVRAAALPTDVTNGGFDVTA